MADHKRNLLIVLFLLLIWSFTSGCASTKGSYSAVIVPKGEELLAKYSNLELEVDCRSDVPLSTPDKERIMKLIVTDLSTEYPDRFKSVNSQTPLPDALHASVMIRKYDEGNAFARAMLAGLGQMHIDADVILTDSTTKDQLAKYDVTKTFAWGGMYGGFTGIKAVEEGFAKAVAAAIAGKKQE